MSSFTCTVPSALPENETNVPIARSAAIHIIVSLGRLVIRQFLCIGPSSGFVGQHLTEHRIQILHIPFAHILRMHLEETSSKVLARVIELHLVTYGCVPLLAALRIEVQIVSIPPVRDGSWKGTNRIVRLGVIIVYGGTVLSIELHQRAASDEREDLQIFRIRSFSAPFWCPEIKYIPDNPMPICRFPGPTYS